MKTVIRIEDLWKEYRLGVIGYGTLQEDLQSWWARKRGKEDPNAPVDILTKSGKISHGTITALKGISLDVEQGEILGIIGANGAGKTTLLKIITGLTAPTAGQVKLKGRVGALLAVGTGMHKELTGRENIFLNGAILGMTKAETASKFDEIVDFSGIDRFIDTPVKRYSSGMNVRLGFAVAAHLEPEILLVDEVLAIGDAEFQKKCLGKIDSVAREGRTVLFVSHNMLAVQNLCTRAVVIESGALVFDGKPEEAVNSYLSSFDDEDSPTVDLTMSPNRHEGSDRMLEHLAILVNGNPTTSIPMGSSFEIILGYDLGMKIVNPVVRVFIEDSYGRHIAELNPEITDSGLMRNLPAKGRLRCCVRRVNLRPGRYYLSLVLWDRLSRRDKISRASMFEMTKADVFGTSKVPGEGIIFLESEWNVEGS